MELGIPPPFGEGLGLALSGGFVGSNPTVYTIVNYTEAHMKKAILALGILISVNAFAYYEDPHEQFDMTRNQSNQIKISFIQTRNVQGVCSAESVKRGKGAFGYSIEACSFWNGSFTECTIVTALRANFHTLGHELRHCLQGNFHKK